MPELSIQPSAAKAESTMYYWLLVVAPAWWLVLDVVAYRWAGIDYWVVSAWMSIALTTFLVLMDSSALSKVGIRVSPWWGILLFPLYLLVRARRARSTWALPGIWLLLCVAYLLAAEPVLTAVSDVG
jgi:hypothetical protein